MDTDSVNKDIGKRIRNLRNRNGLTQQELADRTELTKGFISQLERGEITPEVYRKKLEAYVAKYVELVKTRDLSQAVAGKLKEVAGVNKAGTGKKSKRGEDNGQRKG